MAQSQEEKDLKVGQRLVRDDLVKEGSKLVTLAEKDEAVLATKGWTAERTATLKEKVEALRKFGPEVVQAHEGTVSLGKGVEKLIDEGKRNIKDIIAAAKNAMEDSDDPTVQTSLDQMLSSAKGLGRDPVKVATALEKLADPAQRYKELLATEGIDQTMHEKMTALAARLVKEDGVHQAAAGTLHAPARAAAIAEGETYRLAKKLVRAAQRAFEDDPTRGSEYNLKGLKL